MPTISSIPIKFSSEPLPVDFVGSLEDFRERFIVNLRGTIDTDLVVSGRIGGPRPVDNLGPWLNKRTWYVWSDAINGYAPSEIRVGIDGINSTWLTASPTAQRKITLQDKDGVVALLTDVRIGGNAVVLSGVTPTIDWSKSNTFIETLTGNTTMLSVNSQNGMEIMVLLRNSATSFTVTWPSDIFFPATPVQTPNKADLYILTNVGGTILGKQVANYA